LNIYLLLGDSPELSTVSLYLFNVVVQVLIDTEVAKNVILKEETLQLILSLKS
jgi:hypothetical protein